MIIWEISLTVAAVRLVYCLHIVALTLCTSIPAGLPARPETDAPRVNIAVPPTASDHFLDSCFGEWVGGGGATTTVHVGDGLA
jgi:hypothetical protein